MIGISFIFSAILFTIVWMIFRVNYYKKNKPINRIREIFINLFFIYFLILVNLTLFKYGDLMIDFDNRFYINYIPLVETIKMFNNNFTDIHTALYNVIGNIVLFIPFGFFIYIKFEKNKSKALLAVLIMTLGVEFIQGFIPYRFCDIDDIILNTFGGYIGIIIYNILYLKFNNKIKKIQIT